MIGSPEIRTAIVLYIGVLVYILLQKKDWIFSKDRKTLIQFGLGKDQSIFSLPIIAIVMAIVIYYFVSLYKLHLV